MSKALHIEGVLYLSASEAGKRFGYTSDYISRLARSQKISGQRVGHQWFVDPDSLRRFKYRGDEERALRSEQLRADRKRERALAAVVAETRDDMRATAIPKEVGAVRDLDNPRDRLTALVQAGSILGMGTVVGAFMFLTAHTEAPRAHLSYGEIVESAERIAFALYHADVSIPHRMSAQVIAVGDVEHSVAPTSAPDEGMVVFEEGTYDAGTIAKSFSDEVSVTMDQDGGGGVIEPVFKSGKEERYRFLMVPINSNTSP